jgi:hypothetical protein
VLAQQGLSTKRFLQFLFHCHLHYLVLFNRIRIFRTVNRKFIQHPSIQCRALSEASPYCIEYHYFIWFKSISNKCPTTTFSLHCTSEILWLRCFLQYSFTAKEIMSVTDEMGRHLLLSGVKLTENALQIFQSGLAHCNMLRQKERSRGSMLRSTPSHRNSSLPWSEIQRWEFVQWSLALALFLLLTLPCGWYAILSFRSISVDYCVV